MKLKLDAVGHVVLQDGMPVYVHDDGKELPFDAVSAATKIRELNGEGMTKRQKIAELEGKLSAFGDLDALAAKDALDKLSKIDQKKLVDAGEIDRVRSEITQSVEAKYKPVVEKAAALEASLNKELVGGSFSRSKFITEKLTSPDIAQALFRDNIKIEDGKLVAYDNQGNKIYSRQRAGEPADFEEAIEAIVSAYPNKDHILKASGASGTGAKPSIASASGGKTMTTEAFNALPAAQRAAVMASGTTLTD